MNHTIRITRKKANFDVAEDWVEVEFNDTQDDPAFVQVSETLTGPVDEDGNETTYPNPDYPQSPEQVSLPGYPETMTFTPIDGEAKTAFFKRVKEGITIRETPVVIAEADMPKSADIELASI